MKLQWILPFMIYWLICIKVQFCDKEMHVISEWIELNVLWNSEKMSLQQQHHTIIKSTKLKSLWIWKLAPCFLLIFIVVWNFFFFRMNGTFFVIPYGAVFSSVKHLEMQHFLKVFTTRSFGRKSQAAEIQSYVNMRVGCISLPVGVASWMIVSIHSE